eukprot:TRINITY_DN1592_c2_g2_i1.p1 TRINITY_DN1592_c2_g2~~TRINITY_DN1592_c2_g2_i1.p1  ORF type:complete len:100 (-),score=4.95 TRINITY_DN1592_c2_g2_i1:256-555(-)
MLSFFYQRLKRRATWGRLFKGPVSWDGNDMVFFHSLIPHRYFVDELDPLYEILSYPLIFPPSAGPSGEGRCDDVGVQLRVSDRDDKADLYEEEVIHQCN